MPRSSRYALGVFLFSALALAGLYASESDASAGGARRLAVARPAYLLSFDPSRLLFAAPSIDGVAPASVTHSSLLRVTGANFGSEQGTGQLLIDGEAPTFIAHWSDGLILAYVPESAALGDVAVQVTTVEGTDSAAVNVAERQGTGRIRWSFTVASDSVQRRPAVGPDGTVYLNDIASA